MCGLTGFVQYDSFDENYINLMVKQISSRPDNIGIWVDKERNIALGHSRLSIQDLSSLGNQPMTSHNSRFVIIFNGEIYNHLSIRSIFRERI